MLHYIILNVMFTNHTIITSRVQLSLDQSTLTEFGKAEASLKNILQVWKSWIELEKAQSSRRKLEKKINLVGTSSIKLEKAWLSSKSLDQVKEGLIKSKKAWSSLRSLDKDWKGLTDFEKSRLSLAKLDQVSKDSIKLDKQQSSLKS